MPSLAHSDTTADILDSITGPTGSYTPCSGSTCWAGYAGGQTPSWNGYAARWGYGGGWLNWSIAMNQVLQDNGIQVEGYQYKWVVKNYNANDINNDRSGYPDHLLIDLKIYDQSGNQVYFKRFNYTQVISDWTEFTGAEYFTNPFSPGNIGNINLSALGDDHGYWAGWYGPEFDYNASSLNLIYSADPCYNNPLYGPQCEGYAEAYAEFLYNQNCAANPLYDSGCPGYAQAFFDQQCTIDPLYNTGCPGYATAYFDYQCSLDSLYDSTCPGYGEALYEYNCGQDPLFDSGCTGYAEAYAKKYILNESSETNTTETVSTTPETDVPVTDPEQIAMPSATGDSTVDSILGDLNELPTTIVELDPVSTPTAEIAEAPTATNEAEDTTETAAAGEMEELVADVETEESDSSSEDSGDDSSGEDSSDKDGSGSKDKDDKKESKREKLKKAIAKKASQLAEQMSEAASLEAQQAAQATVLALINYTPGFDQYGVSMSGGYYPDAAAYPDTQLPESRRGLRNGLAQQLLHEQMIDMQYNRE